MGLFWASTPALPFGKEDGEEPGRRVMEQDFRRPPCLSYQETHPVSVWPLHRQLFVAVGYALQLTKNSLKNNHFLSAETQGENARVRGRAHTH